MMAWGVAMVPDRSTLDSFHVILVEPEIAGNVGAIGRTCVASGAVLWLGSPARLPHHRSACSSRGARLLAGPDLSGGRPSRRGCRNTWPGSSLVVQHQGPKRIYTDTTYRTCDGLVFGPESRGLPSRHGSRTTSTVAFGSRFAPRREVSTSALRWPSGCSEAVRQTNFPV